MKNLKCFLLSCLAFGLAFTAVVTPVTTYATSTVSTTENKVTSYEQFISCLKLVEEYADLKQKFNDIMADRESDKMQLTEIGNKITELEKQFKRIV